MAVVVHISFMSPLNRWRGVGIAGVWVRGGRESNLGRGRVSRLVLQYFGAGFLKNDRD